MSGHHDFLNLLVPPSADGFLELRMFNDRRDDLYPLRTFVPAGAPDREKQIDEAIGNAMVSDYDVYMGVAERWEQSGKKAACSWLRALFTDIDFKTTDEATAREKLAAFPLPPSIIIRSGGGLHVYWLLKEPVDLREPGREAEVVSTLKRLANAVGGDPAATDIARVLRVPNTLNGKYDDGPRLVEIEMLRPEVRA